VPKRNYGFEKRQKELNRQQKQEERRLRRQERNKAPSPDSETGDTTPETPAVQDQAGEGER
jgi:hypothetical protein